jgi:hypothetical protein
MQRWLLRRRLSLFHHYDRLLFNDSEGLRILYCCINEFLQQVILFIAPAQFLELLNVASHRIQSNSRIDLFDLTVYVEALEKLFGFLLTLLNAAV